MKAINRLSYFGNVICDNEGQSLRLFAPSARGLTESRELRVQKGSNI